MTKQEPKIKIIMTGKIDKYECSICGERYDTRREAIKCSISPLELATDDEGNVVQVGDCVTVNDEGIGMVTRIETEGHFCYPVIEVMDFLDGEISVIDESENVFIRIPDEVRARIPGFLGITNSEW